MYIFVKVLIISKTDRYSVSSVILVASDLSKYFSTLAETY